MQMLDQMVVYFVFYGRQVSKGKKIRVCLRQAVLHMPRLVKSRN